MGMEHIFIERLKDFELANFELSVYESSGGGGN